LQFFKTLASIKEDDLFGNIQCLVTLPFQAAFAVREHFTQNGSPA
jgi:hypothetical protein